MNMVVWCLQKDFLSYSSCQIVDATTFFILFSNIALDELPMSYQMIGMLTFTRVVVSLVAAAERHYLECFPSTLSHSHAHVDTSQNFPTHLSNACPPSITHPPPIPLRPWKLQSKTHF